MNPIKFPEQNCTYRKKDCLDLPVRKVVNEHYGTEECISCWELSDEDLAYIIESVLTKKRPCIYLSVLGGQPPVSLFVRRESD